jgi:SNF2 family DNA or RNA helicase
MVVYDEATRLKSGRFKTAARKVDGIRKSTGRKTDLGVLNKVRSTVRYLVELSGTPAPKGLIDLWGPIYAIDGGKRLGVSMQSYKDRWFREKKYGYGIEPMPHSQEEIMGRIGDVFFALREEDYLKLPPMIVRDHVLHMDHALMKRYRDFERESAILVRDNAGDPEVIRALNEGVLTGKLLQFANGSLYREDGSHVKLHEKKLDKLESIMEEAAGKPVLVAYSFQFDREAIAKRFRYARFFGDSKNDMRDWNAGNIRMLVIHPASAGHGLNFQHGSNIAVWYGLTWAMELYKQLIKRLHRSGQKADRVFLHRILMAGTADEDVVKVLSQREATQDSITDAVRVRLKKALRTA